MPKNNISPGDGSFVKVTEILTGRKSNAYLNEILRAKSNQTQRSKKGSIKKSLLTKMIKSKRRSIRRLTKRLGEILTVIADCRTSKKLNSTRKCQEKMKKYILKFVRDASANRFKYIF